jgi:hypothetical protein
VGDLLDLSKLQAGRIEPARAAVDVGALLHEVARSFVAQAGDRGIDLAVDEIPADLPGPRRLRADPARDREPRGERDPLHAAGAASGSSPTGGSRSRIEVRDTGPGIQAAQRKRIFEKFARADDWRARRQRPGTALARDRGRTVGRSTWSRTRAEGACSSSSCRRFVSRRRRRADQLPTRSNRSLDDERRSLTARRRELERHHAPPVSST